MNPRFREEQRFEGGWRWFWAGVMLGLGAIAAMVLLVAAATTDIDLMRPLLIIAVVELAELAGLILILRTPVLVQVTGEGVRVRVPPFFKEEIRPAEIAKVEEVPSGLRRRYGTGAGKRYAERIARYTVGDDTGVVIERTNGWRIVVGNKRTTELAATIHDLTRSPNVDRSDRHQACAT